MEKKKEGEGYDVGDIVQEELRLHIPLSNEYETEVYHFLILEKTGPKTYVVMMLETSEVFETSYNTGPLIKHRKVG